MYNGSISKFPIWVQILITILISLALFEFIVFYVVFIFGLFKSCFKNSLTKKTWKIMVSNYCSFSIYFHTSITYSNIINEFTLTI